MSIELVDVSYVYNENTPNKHEALRDINLKFMSGEFVGIIGHTGSGKSTLIQQVNGLLTPTAGKVFIDGIDISKKQPQCKQACRKIGMVFQYPEHQLFEETVYADIAFGPRNTGVDEADIEERVRYGMRFVGLDYNEFKDRSPFSLSGGQMRRVAIAGVIALQPSYLILDEPTAGLDPRGRDEILREIWRLYQETSITVLLVSHNIEEVVKMAKRIIVMHQGTIILDGSPQDIFTRDPEYLATAGIRLPEMARLMLELAGKGKPMRRCALTVEDAFREIIPWAKRGNI